jgi:type II secretory pathway pseudopilin PulG
MRIFISYSSKYRELCERLQLALEADGRHEVFVDRSELTPGRPFDETLRKGIEECDLLLFLLSPESVAAGSYALAELSIAKQRWRHPGGHVLPVKVAPVAKEAIPAYLRAVTILEPQGDLVAETVAAVDAVRLPSRRGRVWALLSAAVLLAGVLGAAGYAQWQRQRAEETQGAEQKQVEQAQAAERQRAQAAQDAQMATLLATTRQLCEAGDYALAWQRHDEADARFPDRPALRQAREDCGMRWLREIHVESGKQTFTDIVNRVLPVLAQGAVSASGQRAADLLAHMGWADYLRIREGAIRLDPVAHYRKALATDAGNVFAHAMWGHHTMVKHEPIAQAGEHFSAALASGRERAFVRTLQFAAMLHYDETDGQVEAARVANHMRLAGETLAPEQRERLWTSVYYRGLLSRERGAFVAALTQDGDPAAKRAAEHAATFAWLFPQAQVREERGALWRYFTASLDEAAGDRAGARARFEALRDELKCLRNSGRICEETLAAIKRLQSR